MRVLGMRECKLSLAYDGRTQSTFFWSYPLAQIVWATNPFVKENNRLPCVIIPLRFIVFWLLNLNLDEMSQWAHIMHLLYNQVEMGWSSTFDAQMQSMVVDARCYCLVGGSHASALREMHCTAFFVSYLLAAAHPRCMSLLDASVSVMIAILWL